MTEEERDEQFYRDTESIAFPKLDDQQLSLLEPISQRRTVKRGDILFKAGQRDFGLIIVLRGEVEVFAQRDGPNKSWGQRANATSPATFRCCKERPHSMFRRTCPTSAVVEKREYAAVDQK